MKISVFLFGNFCTVHVMYTAAYLLHNGYSISKNELHKAADVVLSVVVCLYSSACKRCRNFTLWSATPGIAHTSFHIQFSGRCVGILDDSSKRILWHSFRYLLL